MQTKEERQEGAFALIAAVSEEPMFWDKQAKDFKNIEVKQQKWAEIAFNLGYQDGQTAASKWRNIRDYYAAIKRKCARGRKVTEWPPYFDQLRFLDENDQSMEPNLIKENGSRSFDALTNYRQGHDSGEGRRYVGSASAKATTSSRQLRPILKASPTSNRLVITAATPNKRRRTFADEVRRVDAVTGQIRRIDEQIGVDQILTLLKERESQHSEEDYYGKSVAAILKRLPPYKRALARCRIDQLLFDIEYGEDNGKEQRRQLGLPKRKENQNGKQDIKQRQHQQFALQQLEFDYEDEEQLEEEEEEMAELDEVKVDVDDNNEEELVEEDDAEAGNAVGWEEEGESSNKAVESTKPGRKPRRYWVRPLFQERTTFGAFYQLLPQLRADEQKFIEFAGMSPPLFDRLVEIVGPRLEKTSVRTPIGPQQRLLLTLNFLATGNTFRGLSFLFRISHAAICHIVRETCHAIWEALWAECLPHPSEADWRQAAMGYWDRWQSPNTIGSIDARQLSIKKPAAFSIVLLAVSDHRYRFIYLDVGSYGTDSDGRIFERSAFKEALDTNALNLPPAAALPGADDVVVPHFFVGDAGFPHLPNLQTPIPAIANQQQQMSWEQQIFNYRINRARIPVENAFGLLCARWRILLRQLETTVDNSIRIVKAACVLHNFLCVHETGNNIPATLADVGDQPNGAWRQQISQHLPQAPLRTSCDQLQTTSRLRVEEEAEAMEVRHKLMHFYATVGAVEWQG